MNFIVAVDRNWAIGKDNGLLFSLGADMRYFKQTTMGGTVVMGDKTLLSLPGARPLKGRRNIVMTLDPDFKAEGVELCHSIEELSKALTAVSQGEVFVIGGATIYNLLRENCEYAYITKVFAERPADAFIANLDTLSNWHLESEGEVQNENGLEFSFNIYKNTAVRPL